MEGDNAEKSKDELKNESKNENKLETKKESKSQTKSSASSSSSSPSFGKLVLSSKPNAKTILVDGVKKQAKMGKVELKNISTGSHKIEFIDMRGNSHNKNLTVKKDKTTKYCWNFMKKQKCN